MRPLRGTVRRQHEDRPDRSCGTHRPRCCAERHAWLSEGVWNHSSLALHRRAACFLINPQGLHWSEITPADLVVVNAHGHKIAGKRAVEATAFFVHGAIRREYQGLTLDDAEGERMCSKLEDADVGFLSHHGVIGCGPTVAATLDKLYYLEHACMLQVLAMGTGRTLCIVAERVAAHTVCQMAGESQQAELHFAPIKRMLDRDETGWSTIRCAASGKPCWAARPPVTPCSVISAS